MKPKRQIRSNINKNSRTIRDNKDNYWGQVMKMYGLTKADMRKMANDFDTLTKKVHELIKWASDENLISYIPLESELYNDLDRVMKEAKHLRHAVKSFVEFELKDSRKIKDFEPFYFDEGFRSDAEYILERLDPSKYMDKYDNYKDFVSEQITTKIIGGLGSPREEKETLQWFETNYPEKSKLAKRLFRVTDRKVKDSKNVKDSEDQYEADKYKGKEWGVFAKRSRSWVAFGTEKEMKAKAKRLNELDKKPAGLTLSEYLSQEAEYLERGLQDIDEESYLQGFYHHIWHKAKANNWDKEIVNKMLDYFEILENITVPEALRKASNFIYRSEHASNYEKRNKMKDGAINYRFSKGDKLPTYGFDLRVDYEDEDVKDDEITTAYNETKDLVLLANEKIANKGFELDEEYYGDEVLLEVELGYYEGFTLIIEVNNDSTPGAIDYAVSLMKEIAEKVGLVPMKFGGWTGPVYLDDSKRVKDYYNNDYNKGIAEELKNYLEVEFDVMFDKEQNGWFINQDNIPDSADLVTEGNNWLKENYIQEYREDLVEIFETQGIVRIVCNE